MRKLEDTGLPLGASRRCLTRPRLVGVVASLCCVGVAHPFEFQAIPEADGARLRARVLCSCLFVQRSSVSQCTDPRSAVWRYPYASAVPLVAPGQTWTVEAGVHGAEVQLRSATRVLARAAHPGDGGGCVTVGAAGRTPVTRAMRPEPAPAIPEPLPRAPGALPPDAARALDEGFAEGGALRGHARAALVVHDGHVVGERYAPGYGPGQRYYLGSVAKTLNNLLAGLLVRDGRLSVDEPVLAPEWAEPDDPRRAITFDHLLRMTSGLSWDEDFFTPGAPAYSIYFAGPHGGDVAGFVARRPLESTPGAEFEYSTGASAMLARALQARLPAAGRGPTLAYLDRELFRPLGIGNVVPEFDDTGTLLAGHSAFASPDGLARIGLLYLGDGVWNGRRILPAGWVDYSTRRSPTAEIARHGYGAHLDLDAAGVAGCFGHAGVGEQHLVVCPRRRLVVVWFSSFFDFANLGDDPSDDYVRRIVAAFAPLGE